MRRRKANVELFEEIRREYEFGVGTIQGVARKFGVHRRMVREALGSAVPVERPARPRRGHAWDRWWTSSRRSWRPTGRRRASSGTRPTGSTSAFGRSCRSVRSPSRPCATTCGSGKRRWGCWAGDLRAAELRLGRRSAGRLVRGRGRPGRRAGDAAGVRAAQHGQRGCLPSGLPSGHPAGLPGGPRAGLSLLRWGLPPAALRQPQPAVKRILRGSRREETARFVAFRSHWRFAAEFCTPAEAHEKGGVENEVGTFRRNHWVPVPQAGDLADLNAQLLRPAGRTRARARRARADGGGGDADRAPASAAAGGGGLRPGRGQLPHRERLGLRQGPDQRLLGPGRGGDDRAGEAHRDHRGDLARGSRVASHERCYGRHQEILDLEHYLDVLEHKPGALAGSKPLAQWRQLGRWPASYDRFWQGLIERHGRQAGTKEMIELLQLGRDYGQGGCGRRWRRRWRWAAPTARRCATC